MSIFPKGWTRDLPQKFKISYESHFLWKIPRHDNKCSKCEKGFSRLQKCSGTTSNDFPQKFITFSKSHLVSKIPRHDVQ